MKFKNEKKFPERYYARHIKEGLVHYLENGEDKLYLVTNEALKRMNSSFEGKPIYVRHVETVDLGNLKENADGYVVKSFYNEFDGAWWVEMLVVSDEGHEAVEKGWAVSNCYLPTELGAGGVYHDIDYQKEVKNGKYEHLAIVNNPRYEESVVMTPEEFKNFNDTKQQELQQLKNSKENEDMLSDEDKKALVTSLASELLPALKNAMDEKFEEAKKNAEEEDHRKLLDEADAIAMKPASDFKGGKEEKFRTLTKKLEELGYSRDERGNSKKSEMEIPTIEEEDSHKREKLKLDNADVDKREGVRQIGAIIKEAGGTDEQVREGMGIAEKIGYDESERGTKDNELDEDEKKEKKEKKENSPNWFSALKNARPSVKEGKTLVTPAARFALGKERYGSK